MSAPRAVLVTQEDLAKPCGYNRRIAFIAQTLTQAGVGVTTVGWSRGAPLPLAGETIVAPGLRGAGKLCAMALGYAAALRTHANHVLIASIGAPYNGLFAGALKFVGRRVVYDSQDPVIQQIALLFGGSGVMRVLLLWVACAQRLLDRFTDVTLSVGPGLDRIMRAEGWRGQIVRVYNIHGAIQAGDASRSRLRDRPGWRNAKIVVFAGGLQRWRGIDLQIDAVALARENGADVRLVLVGFHGGEACETYARERGLNEDVAVVLDPVPPHELYDMLADCDFAVSSEDVRYGMQSKIFDYLAAGIRVISIDDGRDVNALLGEFFAFFDGTAEDLARKLAELPPRMTEPERIAARNRLTALWNESTSNVRHAFDLTATH